MSPTGCTQGTTGRDTVPNSTACPDPACGNACFHNYSTCWRHAVAPHATARSAAEPCSAKAAAPLCAGRLPSHYGSKASWRGPHCSMQSRCPLPSIASSMAAVPISQPRSQCSQEGLWKVSTRHRTVCSYQYRCTRDGSPNADTTSPRCSQSTWRGVGVCASPRSHSAARGLPIDRSGAAGGSAGATWPAHLPYVNPTRWPDAEWFWSTTCSRREPRRLPASRRSVRWVARLRGLSRWRAPERRGASLAPPEPGTTATIIPGLPKSSRNANSDKGNLPPAMESPC